MKFLLFFTLILVGCTENNSLSKKPSNSDIEMARCICKNDLSELRVVKRINDEIQFICKNGKVWVHEDVSYTEGCSEI